MSTHDKLHATLDHILNHIPTSGKDHKKIAAEVLLEAIDHYPPAEDSEDPPEAAG